MHTALWWGNLRERTRLRLENNIEMDLNPLNAELNPIRHLLALVGARHIVHVSRIRVNQIGWTRSLWHRMGAVVE